MVYCNLFAFCLRPKNDLSSQILKLKSQRDLLEDYRELIQSRLNEMERSLLKQVKGDGFEDNEQTLRRKSLLANELKLVDKFLLKILEIISNANSSKVEVDVSENIKVGNKFLKRLNAEMKSNFSSVDTPEELKEVAAFLNTSMESLDDQELVNELNTLSDREKEKDKAFETKETQDDKEFHEAKETFEAKETEEVKPQYDGKQSYEEEF